MAASPKRGAGGVTGLSLRVGRLAIPQVDYEPFLSPSGPEGLPVLDLKAVDFGRTVSKEHWAVELESEHLRAVLLPEMGRVYSMVNKATGQETLWQNDVARPGGANNALGWWLWIGGIEYTLPGQEHGFTWAMKWGWEVTEDSTERKTVAARVTEPTTGLHEEVAWTLEAGSSALRTKISVTNPHATDTAHFAHWTNPQWAPGGQNELTDNTELAMPAKRIVIPERWQENLGPSPQDWGTTPLRMLRNWEGMGDLMADGLQEDWYGVYSHDAEEGAVRVFDRRKTPGIDAWTYGFDPKDVPMGSGKPNKGYAEVWGGTVKTFPDETAPLGPKETLSWTEWIFPFHATGGLSFANAALAARADASAGAPGEVDIHICVCPTRRLAPGAKLAAAAPGGGEVLQTLDLAASPSEPGRLNLSVGALFDHLDISVSEGAETIANWTVRLPLPPPSSAGVGAGPRD